MHNTNELYHHGILGMKWGIRRFQKYGEGGYNPKKKGRYIGEQAQSKTYQRMYGMSKKDADDAARRRQEIVKKGLIAGAAVTAGAVTFAMARRAGMKYLDHTIKAGQTLQSLHMNPDRLDDGKAFYAAFKKSDKIIYKGAYGEKVGFLGFGTGRAKTKIEATVKDKMKIASPNSSKKIFNDLMKNDSEFRNAVDKMKLSELEAEAIGDGYKKSKNAYDRFNRWGLTQKNEDAAKAQEKFYEALKKKGYSGVADVNDMFYSNFNTKADIIFDRSKLNKDLKKTKLDFDKDVKRSRPAAEVLRAVRDPKTMALLGAEGTIYGTAGAVTQYDRKVKKEQKKKKKEGK